MMIVLKPDRKLKVWRKATEKWRLGCLGYMCECRGNTLKLMVWGCVTYFGMGTVAFINGNMNFEKYITTLDNYLWPAVTNIMLSIVRYFKRTMPPLTSPDCVKLGSKRTISLYYYGLHSTLI